MEGKKIVAILFGAALGGAEESARIFEKVDTVCSGMIVGSVLPVNVVKELLLPLLASAVEDVANDQLLRLDTE
jgi:hypothetical protein